MFRGENKPSIIYICGHLRVMCRSIGNFWCNFINSQAALLFRADTCDSQWVKIAYTSLCYVYLSWKKYTTSPLEIEVGSFLLRNLNQSKHRVRFFRRNTETLDCIAGGPLTHYCLLGVKHSCGISLWPRLLIYEPNESSQYHIFLI